MFTAGGPAHPKTVQIASLLRCLVIIPTAIAMCGPVYIRHRVGLERLTTNNEIAGFKFATVGVIYAVLLAFAVIVVWERFSEGEGAVLQEASAAATLYRLSAGADPDAAATRAALSNYLKLAIRAVCAIRAPSSDRRSKSCH